MTNVLDNTDKVYHALARHLDRLPAGFPATPDGVEIRILKRLFTEQEAQIATHLTMQMEPARDIADRAGLPPSELEPMLAQMASKGLIFRKNTSKETLFMAAQFVVGIWEYHVNDLDEALIRDFNLYAPYLAEQWRNQKTQQLRVIPISKSIPNQMQVMPYEHAETIIRQQSKIVVAPCICRREHDMSGSGCGKPLEVCLVFGSGGFYYEKNGLGREITRDEALDLLRQGAEAGLVLQPGNSQKVLNMCMCCGCCCQVLKNLKTLPQPASVINNSYVAWVDEEACVACGICAERCPMDAMTVEETARVDLDRCIGCGVCTLTCEAQAIGLRANPEQQRWTPPATVFETYLNIARERGLL